MNKLQTRKEIDAIVKLLAIGNISDMYFVTKAIEQLRLLQQKI